MIRWSKEEEQILKKLYNEGIRIEDIATFINRSVNGVRYKVTSLNLSNRLNYWSCEDIIILKDMYSKNKTLKEMASLLDRSIEDISAKASSLKITRSRRYNIDDGYFSKIHTQKQSYWIGWLITDGYINCRYDKITLMLAAKDKNVIEDFKHDLKSENPIYCSNIKGESFILGNKVNIQNQYGLCFTSSPIARDLARYGIVPQKTYSTEWPEKLEPKYYPGFVAGLISGDGSVSFKKKRKDISISFYGTEKLVTSLRDIISVAIGSNPDKAIVSSSRSDMLYSISFAKKDSLLINNWLQKNGISFMPRKQKVIDDYIKEYPKKCRVVA